MLIFVFCPVRSAKKVAALRNEVRWRVLHEGSRRMCGHAAARTAKRRGWGATWGVAAISFVGASSSVFAQAITPLTPAATPPWNAETVFEPVPYAQLWSRYPGEKVNPEDTPVRTRQWPGYEPVGIRYHSWMFYPSLSVGGLYDSNVFASNKRKKADIAAVVQPSLRVTSLWDRHQVTFDTYVRSEQYNRYSSLDQTDASARMKGRIDLRHNSAIIYNLRAAYLHEAVGSLSSPLGAIEPTPYSYTREDVSYWQPFNRLSASFGLRNENYDYGSTRAKNGSIINQDARDGSIYAAHGRVDYAFSANLGMFTALEGNVRDLRGSPSGSLSSQGYRSLTGLNFGLTRLISGEIGAGYTSQRFENPTIGTVNGPAFRAILTWSPTRSLDIKGKAEEITTEAVDTIASAVRARAAMLGVDYEFRRNITLSMFASYENDKFFGEDRRDNVYSAGASLQYLLNRYSSAALRYKYQNRKSNLSSATYDKHEIGLDVTAHF